MRSTFRLLVPCALAALLLVAACNEETTSNVPETPPEGFEGSCAEALHSWDDIRENPDVVGDFLCLDAPAAGEAVQRGATLSLWASYPYTPEVVIEIRTTAAEGGEAVQSYDRSYDDPGANRTFWLIHLEGAEVPIPQDTPPGGELRIAVAINDAETSNTLVSSEVTAQLSQ